MTLSVATWNLVAALGTASNLIRKELRTWSAGKAKLVNPSDEWVGIWDTFDGFGKPFFITLKANHDAMKSHVTEATGRWEQVALGVQITWSDKWHDILHRSGDHFEKVAFGPGVPLDTEPTNKVRATRRTGGISG